MVRIMEVDGLTNEMSDEKGGKELISVVAQRRKVYKE